MFSNLLRWSDKQTRILISLTIGLHYVDIIKPIVPNAVMLWEKIDNNKPTNVFELKSLI